MLRLTTSHKYLYKKLDEFGQNHTKSIKDAIVQQGKFMFENLERQRKEAHIDVESSKEQYGNSAVEPQLASPSSNASLPLFYPDNGRKITFDNLDYHQEVHYMTEGHQNIDKHFVTSMSTENHVSGNHLRGECPAYGVLQMENRECLPSTDDHAKQRGNYIALVGRVMSENIPCPNSFSEVSIAHIPHKYSCEMRSVSRTVCMLNCSIRIIIEEICCAVSIKSCLMIYPFLFEKSLTLN